MIVLIELMDETPMRNKIVILVKCILAWFAGYGLFWVIRLLLVEIFTQYDGLSTALSRFFTWTGVTEDERYTQYTPMYAMKLCFDTLFQPHNVCIVAGFCGILLFQTIKRAITAKTIRRPSLAYLAIAVIPLLWIVVTARATGNHFWFQYRLLAVFLFATLTFLSQMMPRDKHVAQQLLK